MKLGLKPTLWLAAAALVLVILGGRWLLHHPLVPVLGGLIFAGLLLLAFAFHLLWKGMHDHAYPVRHRYRLPREPRRRRKVQ